MSLARCVVYAGVAMALAVPRECPAQTLGPSNAGLANFGANNSGFNNPYSSFNGGFSSNYSPYGLGSSSSRYNRSSYGSSSYGSRSGGAGNGMAAMIRAQGQANLANSAALINYQRARSSYIDNQVKWQQAYHVLRRGAENFWEQDRQTRAASRDRWLASRGSGAPVRLTAAELNPQSGAIKWPEALQSPAFARVRGRIEDVMAARSHSTSTSSAQLHQDLKDLSNALRAEIHHIPPHEYMDARRFVDSLTHDCEYPAHDS